jgi:hypothetical protein
MATNERRVLATMRWTARADGTVVERSIRAGAQAVSTTVTTRQPLGAELERAPRIKTES